MSGHHNWGRTPRIWLPSVLTEKGYTEQPDDQSWWDRAERLNGYDYPDGWKKKENWDWYSANILVWWRRCVWIPKRDRILARRKVVEVPDVTSLKSVGIAQMPRGFVTRFYVTQYQPTPAFTGSMLKKRDKWWVTDVLYGGIATGTKQSGYDTKKEAVEVAEELRDNRPIYLAKLPF